jgi:hypothetical protein
MYIFVPSALISIQMLFITCIHSRFLGLEFVSLSLERSSVALVITGFLSALSQQYVLLEDESASGCSLDAAIASGDVLSLLPSLEATRAVLSPSCHSCAIITTEWIVRLLPPIHWIRAPCYIESCRRPPLSLSRLDWEPAAFDSIYRHCLRLDQIGVGLTHRWLRGCYDTLLYLWPRDRRCKARAWD